MLLSVPRGSTASNGRSAHSGNCAASRRRTTVSSTVTSSRCIRFTCDEFAVARQSIGASARKEQAVETPESSNRLIGRCECGRVRYRVADEFLYAANCHCSRCRAATGSAFKPFAGIEREKLELTEGGNALLVHGDDQLNDTRCAACGSLLFSVVRDGAYAHVAMGSLVDVPAIRPSEHIFVGSKAPWYEITDDLPQNEEY